MKALDHLSLSCQIKKQTPPKAGPQNYNYYLNINIIGLYTYQLGEKNRLQ